MLGDSLGCGGARALQELHQLAPLSILARRNPEHRVEPPCEVIAIVITHFISNRSHIFLMPA